MGRSGDGKRNNLLGWPKGFVKLEFKLVWPKTVIHIHAFFYKNQ